MLTLFTYPLVLLPLRATLRRIDPQLEDAARAMGRSPLEIFRTRRPAAAWPAIAAGGLLVALYVISDFGAVSIMRFDSFTREIYIAYQSSFDRIAAAGARASCSSSLMLGLLWVNSRLRSRAVSPARPGGGSPAAALPARPLALAGARLLLGGGAGRPGAPGRGADLLGDQGDLLGQHRPTSRSACARNSLLTGVGGGARGARGARGRGCSRPLPGPLTRPIERAGYAGYALPGSSSRWPSSSSRTRAVAGRSTRRSRCWSSP